MRSLVQAVGLNLLPLQLDRGPLGGQALTVELPPLRLVRFQISGRLHCIGEKPKGVLAVSLDLDPRDSIAPWFSHGEPLPVDCLFGQCIERDVHITLPGQISFGMVFVSLSALRSWASELGWPGFDGELLPSSNVHLMHADTAHALRLHLRQLFLMAELAPDRLRQPESQRLVREDLMPLVLEALITGPGQPSRRRRGTPARIELVKDIQRWLHLHPDTPVTLADLCREAHASRRTLIQGFQDHLGMGPMAYVRLLRLHSIRRRLLRAEPGEIQIGPLAEAWGFHNAGHFAANYRRL
ncbi:MAG: helix-turn-helix domain-containing protein, partial [Cyanobacteria bacterium K_Offshore_surface_m2_239]|nr:helix-turn-helix domain-containing protein [Cyanobacteria bacterium K_Offshore_surface_m2_239]